MWIYVNLYRHRNVTSTCGYGGISIPGLRPAVSLTSFATPSSCDWTVKLMQYISLLRVGGWWLSSTEIFGTLEMILKKRRREKSNESTFLSVQRRCRSDSEECCKWREFYWMASWSLNKALHGAVLHGQAVPVQFLTCIRASTPSMRWPASLQGFLRGGRISPRPSPNHKHTAAAVTAQHHLNTCHLNGNTQRNTQSLKRAFCMLSFSFFYTKPHLYLLANIFSLCYKAEAVAFGFSRQKGHMVLTWGLHHTALVVLLHTQWYYIPLNYSLEHLEGNWKWTEVRNKHEKSWS